MSTNKRKSRSGDRTRNLSSQNSRQN